MRYLKNILLLTTISTMSCVMGATDLRDAHLNDDQALNSVTTCEQKRAYSVEEWGEYINPNGLNLDRGENIFSHLPGCEYVPFSDWEEADLRKFLIERIVSSTYGRPINKDEDRLCNLVIGQMCTGPRSLSSGHSDLPDWSSIPNMSSKFMRLTAQFMKASHLLLNIYYRTAHPSLTERDTQEKINSLLDAINIEAPAQRKFNGLLYIQVPEKLKEALLPFHHKVYVACNGIYISGSPFWEIFEKFKLALKAKNPHNKIENIAYGPISIEEPPQPLKEDPDFNGQRPYKIFLTRLPNLGAEGSGATPTAASGLPPTQNLFLQTVRLVVHHHHPHWSLEKVAAFVSKGVKILPVLHSKYFQVSYTSEMENLLSLYNNRVYIAKESVFIASPGDSSSFSGPRDGARRTIEFTFPIEEVSSQTEVSRFQSRQPRPLNPDVQALSYVGASPDTSPPSEKPVVLPRPAARSSSGSPTRKAAPAGRVPGEKIAVKAPPTLNPTPKPHA